MYDTGECDRCGHDRPLRDRVYVGQRGKYIVWADLCYKCNDKVKRREDQDDEVVEFPERAMISYG